MNEPVIEVCQLSCVFGRVTAVREVSFAVPQGSIFALVGRNGAGKTTTLKSLMGLVRPASGEARILGLDCQKQGYRLRRRVGYLPESRANYAYMTVSEVLQFARSLHSCWDEDWVRDSLSEFDLSPGKRVGDLSAGMKTQLGFLLATGHRPDVLILDEPTAGLDPVRIRQLLRLLVQKTAQEGCTILLSSHALHHVERIADHVAVMADGQIETIGQIEDLKHSEKRIRVVFQVDPPQELFERDEIVRLQRDGRRFLVTVQGNPERVMQDFRRIPHFALDLLDMNLEEMFWEYTGRDESDEV